MPKSPPIDPIEYEKAMDRAGGVCERCKLPFPRRSPSCLWGLQAHHDPEKGMGGTTRVYTAKDLRVECGYCHGTWRSGGRPTDAQVEKWRTNENMRR